MKVLIFYGAAFLAACPLTLLPATTLGFTPSGQRYRHVRSQGIVTTSEPFHSVPILLQSSISSHQSTSEFDDSGNDNSSSNKNSGKNLRKKLRKITGFSLTALRTTLRGVTGISLSAIYASTLAVTGAWIRQTMKVVLGVFPAWARYFVQPFLILYYAPLFILRNLTGPTRKRARKTHEHFMEGWKEAVETADEKSAYWPVHLSKDGTLEKDFDEVDMNKAIAESVEVALEEEEKN